MAETITITLPDGVTADEVLTGFAVKNGWTPTTKKLAETLTDKFCATRDDAVAAVAEIKASGGLHSNTSDHGDGTYTVHYFEMLEVPSVPAPDRGLELFESDFRDRAIEMAVSITPIPIPDKPLTPAEWDKHRADHEKAARAIAEGVFKGKGKVRKWPPQ
jgi:hypothetical protein